MKIILYHNNNCSKSRTCLDLLKKKKIKFEVRNYLKNPLSMEEIKDIVEKIQGNQNELVRKSKDFSENLINTQDKLTKLIFENQKLLQRPILYYKNYWVCRPPERALEILG